MGLLISALPWIQFGLSILLIGSVLMQQSSAGLGSAFGGSGSGEFHTRRGFEKTLFNTAGIAGAFFAASSLAALLLR